MCTLWMSNATNLSHIDGISKESISNTLVEAILPSPCVLVYKRLDDKNISQEGFWTVSAGRSPQTKSLILLSLDLIYCWIQAEGLSMCTLWMSNATNLSHIDSISKESILNTLVETILPLPCVLVYKRLDDGKSFIMKVSELWALEGPPKQRRSFCWVWILIYC